MVRRLGSSKNWSWFLLSLVLIAISISIPFSSPLPSSPSFNSRSPSLSLPYYSSHDRPIDKNNNHASTGASTTTSLAHHESNDNKDGPDDCATLYAQARNIRVRHGHAAAVPLYQELLKKYGDVTAATRIAAAESSIRRHDLACPLPCYDRRRRRSDGDGNAGVDQEDMERLEAIPRLRWMLQQSGYHNENIQKLFGIQIKNIQNENTNKNGGKDGNDDDCNDCNDGDMGNHDNYDYEQMLWRKEWSKAEALAFAKGPVYISPVPAGPITDLPMFMDGSRSSRDVPDDGSLACLVAMFLLGLSVPRDVLVQQLMDGEETIALLEYLGLAFPCESDPSMIVPYVHIFPLQVEVLLDKNSTETKIATRTKSATTTTMTTLLLVTDLHPTILSQTTVGENDNGTVMYIGPDSLALVQHLPLRLHLQNVVEEKKRKMRVRTGGETVIGGGNGDGDGESRSSRSSGESFRILDLCTGSGVQALAVLMSLMYVDPTATAVCVDVNDRALRFTRFNALLNGLEDDNRVCTIRADVVSGECWKDGRKWKDDILHVLMHGMVVEDEEKEERGGDGEQRGLRVYCSMPCAPFDFILSNPPFIPTPQHDCHHSQSCDDQRGDVSEVISKRYGLFSSGGASGEDVLQAVISMSSRLLCKEHGLLAIVSEFMNPPTASMVDGNEVDPTQLLYKLSKWWKILPSWSSSSDNVEMIGKARGLLFTNEFPVSAETYAARRADDKNEYCTWLQNLKEQEIECISPGLLYIETASPGRALETTINTTAELELEYRIVPRSQVLGSLWTPYNYKALLFTWCEWLTWKSAAL